MRKAERGGECLQRPRQPGRRRPVARAAAEGPADVGAWTTAPFQIPVMAIHAAMLPTGKVMWFSYPRKIRAVAPPVPAAPNTAQAWLWDPETGQTKRVDPPLWRDPRTDSSSRPTSGAPGQTFTKDGRLVVFGGNLDYSRAGGVDFKGLNKVYTFNPFNETWTEQPDMRHGRWYPRACACLTGASRSTMGWTRRAWTRHRVTTRTRRSRSSRRHQTWTARDDASTGGQRHGESGRRPTAATYPHMKLMPSGRTLIAGPGPG